MKAKIALLTAVVMAVAGLSTPVFADRGGYYGGPRGGYRGGHHGGLGWAVPGLVLGSALVWAATRPTVVYQEPVRTVVVPAPEPVVIAPQASSNWWYYCRSAGAYYPYVTTCAGAWEKVPATP